MTIGLFDVVDMEEVEVVNLSSLVVAFPCLFHLQICLVLIVLVHCFFEVGLLALLC